MSAFTESFGAWAASAQPPEAARAEARLALLDTVGCIAAGWEEPQTRAARAAFGGDGGAQASALILGAAAHALDFDDYEAPGSTHPSAPILGAVLALAQASPPRLGALLDAYVVGFEAVVRLGRWLRYDHYAAGWHATGTLGAVGAAAASARLLGLDASASAAALALSASLGAGLKAQFGSDAKALHAGFAARAGVEAALLAAAGAGGARDVFEGPFGFARMHHGAADAPGAALGEFGRPFGILEHPILRKPWPCCAYTHRAIDAALTLRPQLPERSAWAGVTLRMPEPFFRVVRFRYPTTPSEARFSASYAVAAALLDGAVGPESFQSGAFLRGEIAALLALIEVDAYDAGPGLEDMSPAHPDTLTVRLKDGRRLSAVVDHVVGGAQRPLSRAALRAKFTLCGGADATAELILEADAAQRLAVGPLGAGFALSRVDLAGCQG